MNQRKNRLYPASMVVCADCVDEWDLEWIGGMDLSRKASKEHKGTCSICAVPLGGSAHITPAVPDGVLLVTPGEVVSSG